MLRNYLKITLRHLRKHKSYAFINAFGLAVGIACCVLILLYIREEVSHDRYHEKADRIYRLTTPEWARTPPAAAPALKTSYPHLVEQAVRFWRLFAPAKVRRDDVVFVETDVTFADPGIFSVFSWPMIAGAPEEALAAPNSIVLTRSMAAKYFGVEDPLGATLQFWGSDMTVTGVIEDVPPNSHYRFDFLIPFSKLYEVMGSNLDEEWGMPAFYTYVLAREGVEPEKIEAAARQLYDARLGGEAPGPVLQPLPLIYLHSDLQGEPGTGGNLAYLYVLATAAALVLLLACVNFTNLTTARASSRAKEVGMRKALGARRLQLAGQFLGETVLMSTAALLLALMLVELSLPAFNQVAGKAIEVRYAADPLLIAGLLGLTLLVGLIAGGYPAFLLSGFQPVRVLKGMGGLRASSLLLRKGLVMFQFTVSTTLTIGVAIVFLQLGYLQNKDLGFDEEHVLVLDGDRFPLIKEILREVPGVVHVAGAPAVLGSPLPRSRFEAEGVPTDSTSQMLRLGATTGYVETMGMRMVAGRSFTEESGLDADEAFVLNESAVRALGWADPAEAVGKSFAMSVPPMDGGEEVWREGHIVGVVEDFHHSALYDAIEPVALYPSRDLNLTFVRVRDVNAGVLAGIEAAWKEVNPDAPFNYYFLDEYLGQQYRAEQRLSRIIGASTGLAILIACLGLFGLAAFTAEQRTKEIGVRKVLGASVADIVGLLTKDFVRLVLAATLLATPVGYFTMRKWLENFAYRIEIGPGVFLLAGGAALLVALLTVSYQAVKAALADPVKSLRYE